MTGIVSGVPAMSECMELFGGTVSLDRLHSGIAHTVTRISFVTFSEKKVICNTRWRRHGR